MLVASHLGISQGSNQWPRYMSWLGIKPTTFRCMGQCSNQRSHPARAWLACLLVSYSFMEKTDNEKGIINGIWLQVANTNTRETYTYLWTGVRAEKLASGLCQWIQKAICYLSTSDWLLAIHKNITNFLLKTWLGTVSSSEVHIFQGKKVGPSRLARFSK